MELDTGYITCTDHGTLTACRTVYDLARTKKLTPILGVEAYFRDDDDPILKAAGVAKIPVKDKEGNITGQSFASYWKYAHLTMHALDQVGYEAIVRLLSKADLRAERHGSERKPLFGWADLEELGAHNVTMTSGCLVGMVGRHLNDHDDPAMAERYYARLRSVVKPGNFYVELFPHDCSKNWANGIFVTLAGGDGFTKLRFWTGKMVRTNVGELSAADLVKQYQKQQAAREKEGRTDLAEGEHAQLLAVKDYQTWTERAPLRIVNVEHIADYLPNECRPWCPDGDVQKGMNRWMRRIAAKYGDPILIGDDSHFATPDEKVVQDIRLLQGGQADWRFYGSYHRQSSAEAFEFFSRTIGTSEADFERYVDNAHGWASRFKDFKLEYQPSLPTSFYPTDTLAHTHRLIEKHGRMDWDNLAYVERLNVELKLLHANGTIDLLPYFFLGEEVCSLHEANGLLTGPGRGSAAGLLLTYLLGITHVDPLEFNLSLERFLTLDRIRSGKLPDIDQDLPHRELLVHSEDATKGWLADRFGDHVAQIGTDTTLKLRNAVKDVARVQHGGRVPPDVERYAGRFQNAPQGVSDRDFVFGYQSGDEWALGSIETDPALRDYIARYPDDWKIVQRALGLTRQKGRHACGYVVADKPISSFIPLMEVGGVRVTQYTAAAVEACGGIKMDFLVVNSLKDIGDAIQLIQGRSGVDIPDAVKINGKRVPRIRVVPHDGQLLDVWKLWVSPYAAEVFLDVAAGKTETVFQFNTQGAVQYLKHFDFEKVDRPGVKAIDSIEAMSAFTALDRPGPLNAMVKSPEEGEHNMLVEFARRARGAEKSPDVLPVFDELFPETYGVMVYQEQLQRLYQAVTGCSGPDAEEFRSNVAKKKMEKILKAYPVFMEKAAAKMGSQENAQAVWDFIVSWGQYGFNKSHAVCYSVIGFACAYLKKHFPLEWWTAVLRNADKGEVNEKFWRYCGNLIDLPDVKLSGSNFEIQSTARGERIRAPLSLLHGVGEGAHRQLALYSPYTDIDDFCQKVQQHKEAGARRWTEETIVVRSKKNRKTGEVTERAFTKLTEKVKLAHSALHRGTIYALIVSGALDSLFPEEMQPLIAAGNFLDQLEAYEAALSRASGKKLERVSAYYKSVHEIMRYQLRKRILPAYSASLLPMFLRRKVAGVELHGGWPHYVAENMAEPLPFATPRKLDALDATRPWPDDLRITVAVAAYVEGQRRFQYQNKTKEAIAYKLDFNGVRYETVKWPRGAGGFKGTFALDLEGAVVIALLSKYAEDRPFAVDDLVVVQPPIGDAPKETE